MKAEPMVNPRAGTIARDIDVLFHHGVVSGMSDGELLDRFVTGSGCDAMGEIAFDAIVRRYGPMVLGVCLRVLGDYHAAQDAFQATFMVLAVRARQIRKRESLGPWLHGVAARIARRALMLGRRRREESLALAVISHREPDAPDSALADLGAVLDEELGRLPDKYRLPLVLCYLQGQTQEEAARTLGWTKGTVSGRLARAKDVLRQRLVRRGLAPGTVFLAAYWTSETASAAVPAALLCATVRAAVAAGLGFAETTQVTARVAAMVRQSLKAMSLLQMGRMAAQIMILGLGTAAIATPMLFSRRLEPAPDALPRPPSVARRLTHSPRFDRADARLDRFGDPLPPRVRMRLGTTKWRHPAEVVGMDFLSDGKSLVSARSDGVLHFWDPISGHSSETIDLMGDESRPERSIRNVTVSADGRFIAGLSTAEDSATHASTRSLWIKGLPDGRQIRTIADDPAHVANLVISPDGATLASGTSDGEVRLWNVATGAGRSIAMRVVGSVPLLAFAPDGKTLAISGLRNQVMLWDLDRDRGTVLAGLTNGPFAPCFSADGRLMAVNAIDGRAIIINRSDGRSLFVAQGVAHGFAPDGRLVAMIGADGALQVIETDTGATLWGSDLGFALGTTSVRFSPDCGTVVASRGGVLRSFDAESGRERFANSEAHQGGVKVVAYTPPGHTIVTAGDDGTVRLWNARDARQVGLFRHRGRVHLLVVSPDGRSLATAALLPDAFVRVWDLATGRPTHEWPGHGDVTGAEALAFSADGRFLLSYGRDNVLKVHELEGGRERPAVQPRFLLGKGGGPSSVMLGGAFSPEIGFWPSPRTARRTWST